MHPRTWAQGETAILNRKATMVAIKLGITVLLLAAVLYYVNLHALWQKVRAVDPRWLFWAWCCLVVGYVLCGIRWAWMAEGLGLTVSVSRKINLYFLGMFASLFLPSTIGGDVLRGILLAKGEGRTGAGWQATASVLLDRINGLYALSLLVSLAMLAFHWPAVWWFGWLCGVAAMWIGLALYPRLHDRIPERFAAIRQLPIGDKRLNVRWWRSLPVSFAFQLLIVQAHVFLGMAVGLHMSWPAFAVMVGLVGLMAFVPISLNGLGVREAGYVGFAVYFGADASAAAAMSVLWLVVLSLASLPGAVVLWRVGGLRSLR
jgi:uncharacterized membrane protein YbhN (UPF0104 family)